MQYIPETKLYRGLCRIKWMQRELHQRYDQNSNLKYLEEIVELDDIHFND